MKSKSAGDIAAPSFSCIFSADADADAVPARPPLGPATFILFLAPAAAFAFATVSAAAPRSVVFSSMPPKDTAAS